MDALAVPYACTRCGSSRVHRSAARSTAEWLALAVTPLHVARCRGCGRRWWTWKAPPAPGAADTPPLTLTLHARRFEPRDLLARHRQLRRVALAVVSAAALGAVAAALLAG